MSLRLHTAGVIAGGVAIIVLLSCCWAWQRDKVEQEAALARGNQPSPRPAHVTHLLNAVDGCLQLRGCGHQALPFARPESDVSSASACQGSCTS